MNNKELSQKEEGLYIGLVLLEFAVLWKANIFYHALRLPNYLTPVIHRPLVFPVAALTIVICFAAILFLPGIIVSRLELAKEVSE